MNCFVRYSFTHSSTFRVFGTQSLFDGIYNEDNKECNGCISFRYKCKKYQKQEKQKKFGPNTEHRMKTHKAEIKCSVKSF